MDERENYWQKTEFVMSVNAPEVSPGDSPIHPLGDSTGGSLEFPITDASH